jgi:hypothetical protein
MLSADGFEKVIIGVQINAEKPVIVYDFEKCVKIIMTWQGIEDEFEALNYLHFNVIGTNLGNRSPIFIRKHKTIAEIEDFDYDDEE